MPLHPNQLKYRETVQRWIADAQARSDGAECLLNKAHIASDQMSELRVFPGAKHLRGLTEWDLSDARDALLAAYLKKLEANRDDSLVALGSAVADFAANTALRMVA